MFSLPGIGRRFSGNVRAFPWVLPRASRVSCIWNKYEPKASLRREMVFFLLFPPLSFFFSFSLRSIREVTLQRSGRAKSWLVLRPSSLRPIKLSSRLSTSGGRWPSSAGTYWLSNDSVVLEKYLPGGENTRVDKFVRHDHSRHCNIVSRSRALRLCNFGRNTRQRHDTHKGSHNFKRVYSPIMRKDYW